jgi:hypothetical protein
VSSTSFISAVSSQEDMALVNLHMQVNKPIIDSPLLMSSYVNHLSQVIMKSNQKIREFIDQLKMYHLFKECTVL